MKVIKVLWGLIFDDWRLVLTLVIGLILSAILALAHIKLAAAIVFWLFLPLSLWISIEAELRKRLRKGQ
ncbi:hypothetical protein [Alicyclobacillus dauci]|uniref:Uncharacterized protein n=1 Tax=Alicyclobacillus dauci TaxID=1475485 RepID=A0ABY6Z2P6_9BACL|nr:hypothetical protein [Alicyclobacillus dauci]WAH37015.1 hypothetical protein NZD86_00040 [Alicyclobacillus dauci]